MTRPADQAERLVSGLRALGGEPLSYPTIRIEEPTDLERLRRAAREVAEYDWVVFTSANGVERFLELIAADVAEWPSRTRVAAIGPATAAALESRRVRADVVPGEYVAEEVAEAVIERGDVVGRRILLPRAAGARAVLRERLEQAGALVDEVVAYESRPDTEGIKRLRAGLEQEEIDMVTFTAASTVRHYVEAAGPELGKARVAVIGPITAAAARDAGVRVDAVADEYSVEGLLRAICEYYSDLEQGT